MVKGLGKFKEYFKEFSENYVLIGGVACDILISDSGFNFRATKDFDLVLVVESISEKFIERLWSFIKDGKYKRKEKNNKKREYYRFSKPEINDFPFQIEIFSRIPDIFENIRKNNLFTLISVGQDVSSLSAILLDDDYYNFTVSNRENRDGIMVASVESLIVLKAKAYLDMMIRKQNGEKIDQKNIKKHRNDVIRLFVLLKGNYIKTPEKIKKDIRFFIDDIENRKDDFKNLFKVMGLPNIDFTGLINQIKITFGL